MSIKSERADQLARELATLTGRSITDAVVEALEVRLAEELRRRRPNRSLADIVQRFAQLPILDPRSPEEILGYDRHGLPS